jgi:hypothetical protein
VGRRSAFRRFRMSLNSSDRRGDQAGHPAEVRAAAISRSRVLVPAGNWLRRQLFDERYLQFGHLPRQRPVFRRHRMAASDRQEPRRSAASSFSFVLYGSLPKA